MPCIKCEKAPCECPQTLQKPPKYLYHDCATPGCFTQIKQRIDQYVPDLLCKWCEAGTSHAMRGQPTIDIRLRDCVKA